MNVKQQTREKIKKSKKKLLNMPDILKNTFPYYVDDDFF